MTKAELRKEWEARVATFVASGQSTTAWCAAHNLKPHQLRYWLRRLNPKGTPTATPSQWVSLELNDISPNKDRNGLVVRVGQAVIEVQSGFNPELLKEVVQTLTEL
ncbi:IS66 family insertion sequence element accessory protein TnpA [Desulfotomaculum nigrificans]|uniref:IS66 family insertion sequence element accessory protein TnpA n=1 Tax=Desulfotomaculum nigrificans TaxID=1565 RepID=UPI0001FAE999|nr:hypothetical protein [Desulfotomaculum nigrificans]